MNLLIALLVGVSLGILGLAAVIYNNPVTARSLILRIGDRIKGLFKK